MTGGGRPGAALVTGGASGIGAAIVRELRADGWRVAVADLRAPAAELDVQLSVPTDVADPADCAAAVEAAETEFGRLDRVFLNAGMATGTPSGLTEVTVAHYRRVVGVNLDGVFFGAQAAVPALRRAGGGALVVTASLAGLTPFADDPVYTLTKHAVVGLVRSLGPALAAEHIVAAAVCPGFTATPLLTPLLAAFTAADFPLLTAEEVGRAAVLAADGPPGSCWTVQPGRAAEPYRFRGVPAARRAGQTARLPDLASDGAG